MPGGVRPNGSRSADIERRPDRILVVADVPHRGDRTAGRSTRAISATAADGVEPVEGLAATVTPSDAGTASGSASAVPPTVNRGHAGRAAPRACRRRARPPRSVRRSRRAPASACRCRPRGRGRERPARGRSSSAQQRQGFGGVVGAAALVGAGRAVEAERRGRVDAARQTPAAAANSRATSSGGAVRTRGRRRRRGAARRPGGARRRSRRGRAARESDVTPCSGSPQATMPSNQHRSVSQLSGEAVQRHPGAHQPHADRADLLVARPHAGLHVVAAVRPSRRARRTRG